VQVWQVSRSLSSSSGATAKLGEQIENVGESMLISVLFLALGLVLIILGGQWFVQAAVRTADFLRMPRAVIGSTLVSLATTTPELAVAVMAGLKGEPGLAVGNAVGSCICNIGLILGLTAALKHVDVCWRALRLPTVVMMLGGISLFLMTLNLALSRWQGAALLLAGASYFAWDFWQHYRGRAPLDRAEAAATANLISDARRGWSRSGTGTALQFLGGAAVVVLGSRLLVVGAVDVAAWLGIPPIIIGLTVVALGTSLPELVTGVSSARQSVSDLSVGNVLGANIANLTLIVGTAALIQHVSLDRVTQVFNFPAMLAIMGLLVWMMVTDRQVTRREGVTLLIIYSAYITTLACLAAWAN